MSSLGRTARLVAVLSFTAPLPFARTDPFTIANALCAPFSSDLTASPSLQQVAWLVNDQGKRNLWSARLSGGQSRPLTAFHEDDGLELGEVAWSPDSTQIYFTRGGDFENGGDNPNPTVQPAGVEQSIWVASISADTPPRKLIEGHAPTPSPAGKQIAFLRSGQIWLMSADGSNSTRSVALRGEPGDLRWSPDGQSLAFVLSRNDHSFIALYSTSSKSVEFLDGSFDRDSAPVWSADGAHIAFLRQPSPPPDFEAKRAGLPWSIRVFDLHQHASHEVFRAKPGPGSVYQPIDAKDQLIWTQHDHLVFPSEQNKWLHLYSIPVSGGEPQELTPGAGEVEQVAPFLPGRPVLYSSNIGDIDRRHLSEVDPDRPQLPARQITRGEGIEFSPVRTEGSSIAYLSSSVQDRAHPVFANGEVRKDGKQGLDGKEGLSPTRSQSLMDQPSGYPADRMITPQAVLITASDGLVTHGQLLLPPGPAGRRHPALIFFHGGSRRQMLLGSHYRYYYSNAYALNQFFAHQGYIVLSVNYRSGIGYGLDFREALHYGRGGGSEFNDVVGAGLFLRSRSDVDPSRIGVWGGSYGGYLTALALARASDLFAAGVDMHGVHDWTTTSPIKSVGGDPEQSRATEEAIRRAFQASPLASISSWRSPVLLIHGDDDRNVSFSESVRLIAALRKQGVDVEQLVFPNEVHDFLLHRDWLRAYQATADFFARKLKLDYSE